MKKFNVRVYGILLSDTKQVLVSDEYIRGKYYTKFPGGGLEFGESTRDCLRREFKEEMDLEVSVEEHIYTTDVFQMSAFNPDDQLIAIYYFVKALEPIRAIIKDKEFDFDEQQMEVYNKTQQIESVRFIDWANFSADLITLPIDKIAAALLIENF